MITYGDLVQFEPLMEIKQLTLANQLDVARQDVATFVVSDDMRQSLAGILVPHLRFDTGGAHKGLFMVATYGTGKTHLMSVVSAVAEHAELLPELADEGARDVLAPVAGLFRVVRMEIGTTTMALRDFVCERLERELSNMGVAYHFPPMDQVPGTKDLLQDMMQAFQAVYPDHGLLFVLDELLDYLRSRRDLELIRDLAFLREVGEVCQPTRFRFIAGLQESLFDNPRFTSVAHELIRVRERYELLRISREDVAFVIQERLLRKTVAQRDAIRIHLQRFTPAFEGMAEHLEDYVRLFPVHPSYLRAFAQMTMVEKRKVLWTVSQAMQPLLHIEVPDDEPGLICYDSCWDVFDDPAYRSDPDIKLVWDKAGVLTDRVKRSMPTRAYEPTATRIIHALAVQRLTTDDIHAPLGPTIPELRDDLCLLPDGVPEREAGFIQVTLETVVDEMVRTVSGQFITQNPTNGQLYLDVRKDIDYDQLIKDRAGSLDTHRLDEAYFTALAQVLEQRDNPYVSGYRIWSYDLPWPEKNVTRGGYLFMGAPNERSTVQPPRDFYLYFLQLFDVPSYRDEMRPDEVFFRLGDQSPLDEEFVAALKRYAAAQALARESTHAHRPVYGEKASAELRSMVRWLTEHIHSHMGVTHRGDVKSLGRWLRASPLPDRQSIRQQVDAVSAEVLSAHFADRYPGYPRFGVLVTGANLDSTVKQALAHVVQGRATNATALALSALQLLDDDSRLTDRGPFAQHLLQALAAQEGKALNRAQLLTRVEKGVETWGPWHLEPAWLVVVAAVCCQLGRLELGYAGRQLDARQLTQLLTMAPDALADLSHVAPPAPSSTASLRELAQLLHLAPAAVPDAGANGQVVLLVQNALRTLLQQVSKARGSLASGVRLWGDAVGRDPEHRDRDLEALQRVLEDVQGLDSVGKLDKLSIAPDKLEPARRGRHQLTWVEDAVATVERLGEVADYLRVATDVFGSQYPLSDAAGSIRQDMLALFSDAGVALDRVRGVQEAANRVRAQFADEAVRRHRRDRLDAAQDEEKRRLVEGDVYRGLKRLAGVDMLPGGAFGSIERQLASLTTCKAFDERAMQKGVVCQACGYRPAPSQGASAAASLASLVEQVHQLWDTWEATLKDELSKPEPYAQVALLEASEQRAVRAFVDQGTLPDPVTDVLVSGINHALKKFVVRRVGRDDLWAALFPPPEQPVTLQDLGQRFAEFVGQMQHGEDPERVRVLPKGEGDA